MNKYRKKPVVIEAVQLTPENYAEVKAWCGGTYYSTPPMRAVTGLSIVTLEGTMNALFGDYVIKGVKGEFYPCKADIFEATYELVDEASEALTQEMKNWFGHGEVDVDVMLASGQVTPRRIVELWRTCPDSPGYREP